MSTQSAINWFNRPGGLDQHRHPPPPDDEILPHVIAPDWMFNFDVEEVEGVDELRRRIRDAEHSRNRVEKWSYILGDHIRYENSKIDSKTGIWNMGAANDCVNLGTEHCQVEPDNCYAKRSEFNFPKPLNFRRRQAIIWSYLDAATWAKAYRLHYERKRNPVTTLRINEANDFSTRHDILRVNEIARRLDDIVDVYTYSASSWLDWSDSEHFTVNQSNDDGDFGDKRYIVVDSVSAIPDGGIRCPHDTDESIKCGECRLCIEPEAPDVYVKNVYE